MDTIPFSNQIEIILEKKKLQKNDFEKFPNPIQGFGWSIGVATFQTDFSQFTNELGNENVQLLENTSMHYSFDFHGYINKFYLCIGGGNNEQKKELDSIKQRVFSGHIATYFGYNILNKWITVTPTVGLLTFRSRLFNSSVGDTEQLINYVQNKEIDLKMRKYFASGGVDVNIRLNRNPSFQGEYFLLGFRTNYLLDLHANTILNSKENRLKSNSTIDFNNLHFRIVLMMFM